MTKRPIPTLKRTPPVGEPLRGRTARWFPFHGAQQLGDPKGYKTKYEAHQQGLLCLVEQGETTSNAASYAEPAPSNQTAKLTIEFSGDLADSLRAIANLVDEHGPAFLSDPNAFFSIFNDGAVHRVDIDVSETAPVEPSEVW